MATVYVGPASAGAADGSSRGNQFALEGEIGNISPGDAIELADDQGDYVDLSINPGVSGTGRGANRIRYYTNNGAQAKLTGSGYVIVTGLDYIKVQDVDCEGSRYFFANDSTKLILDDVNYTAVSADPTLKLTNAMNNTLRGAADFVIANCSIDGNITAGSGGGMDIIRLRDAIRGYFLGCNFGDAGHTTVDMENASYIRYKSCLFENAVNHAIVGRDTNGIANHIYFEDVGFREAGQGLISITVDYDSNDPASINIPASNSSNTDRGAHSEAVRMWGSEHIFNRVYIMKSGAGDEDVGDAKPGLGMVARNDTNGDRIIENNRLYHSVITQNYGWAIECGSNIDNDGTPPVGDAAYGGNKFRNMIITANNQDNPRGDASVFGDLAISYTENTNGEYSSPDEWRACLLGASADDLVVNDDGTDRTMAGAISSMDSDRADFDSSCIVGSPEFTDPLNYDFSLVPGATGLNAATFLTTIPLSGSSSTSCTFADGYWFVGGAWDGHTIYDENDSALPGQSVWIEDAGGGSYTEIEITVLASDTGVATLGTAHTWDAGAEVWSENPNTAVPHMGLDQTAASEAASASGLSLISLPIG